MARSRSQPLIMTAGAYDAMIAHCIKGSALACCGILAGVPPTASVAYPLRNAANSRVRYDADSRDLLQAAQDLRERGLALVAIYHFRPKLAAIPSPTDLRENYYGDLPRVIIALGERPTVRAWRLAPRYCEELSWRLQPHEGDSADGGDGEESVIEGHGTVQPSASFLTRLLRRSWSWRRPSRRIPIEHLEDYPPLVPEPMWDPLLDRPTSRAHQPRAEADDRA
jgi:proteasome lid subunit RPN8/RPN11